MSPKDELKNYAHIDLLYPSKYAKAADLRGKPTALVIESITPREELMMQGGKKDTKPVVYFKGAQKGIVLNKTNARAIAKVYGPETLGWLGKTIVLVSAKVECRGEQVDAIRVDIEATRKYLTGSVDTPAPTE